MTSTQRFTAKQNAFIDAMAATGDKRYALQKAGYNTTHVQLADKMMRDAGLANEVKRREEEKLIIEGVPAAVQCLITIARDDRYAPGARVNASKVILDKAGVGVDLRAHDKEPHEMTREELAEAIAKLEQEAASKARDVTPEPSLNDDESDVFE